MVSSQESKEEVSLVSIEKQEVGDDISRSWVDNMKTFLLGNGYPDGLDTEKRR